ncbi:hypothetical protein [Pseudomonas phage vB_PaeM_RP6]|nr:hypothetical protein [Pseudomonas phage vB_PaeM_RP15]WAB56923.1 hypothetical protein [Pseudomonas phage vB_PaeM_RP6]WAB57434.1 hypothetical protein [Pseudomonas phage vB_PaeM_RP9]WAB57722.1 hypothetical protein [Pseudomonas phage vB_PaeM_RP10]WAB57838.1 hypothetical protein [Pseudomonas phage vB_PaeM_RP11]WAB57948.1 hypothetical protein [Pseudomonas phage vB_PaeM_RP12]WAB58125.1 hypothetical protein [Pseudomonas phage vB_PaeM_RP13]WAB58357.1 hypothetical protein [Pseudomonas phage vB_PaeM
MRMEDYVVIKCRVDTGFAGGVHEDEEHMPRGEWEEMSEKERNQFLEDFAKDVVSNHIDAYAWVEEE